MNYTVDRIFRQWSQRLSRRDVISVLLLNGLVSQMVSISPVFAEMSSGFSPVPDIVMEYGSQQQPHVKSSLLSKNARVALNKIQNKSDFGLGWKAKPLVDTTPKPVTPAVLPVVTAPKVDPAAETFLRPMLPFIASVESNLQIHPNTQQSIQNRLNNLQTVLFGSVLYQDPAECLSKIAELYPQEAQKSRQQLLSDLQRKTLTPRNVYATSPTPAKTTIPGVPDTKSSGFSSFKAPFKNKSSSDSASPYSQQPKSASSWFSAKSDNDPFKNDPFFNDSRNTHSSGVSKVGNGLKAFGQGLAGLASVAAPVAGAYFLNKSLGNNTSNLNQPLPNTTYPYGFPVDAYGNPLYSTTYPLNGTYNGVYIPYGSGYTAPYNSNVFRGPYGSSYYRDPLSGQFIPYTTANRTPILRSYPPTYSTQTVVSPW